MADTSARLKTLARELTASRGLAGFTIEELCDEVGVSRRTFFNYFASKEKAVLGIPERLETSDLDDDFVANSTGPLVDALAQLFISRWERMDLTADEIPALSAAMEREPRLIGHLLELAGESEREDILLVERREGAQPGDARAAAAVQILGAVLRASATEALEHSTPDPFPTIFLRRLAAARDVFSA